MGLNIIETSMDGLYLLEPQVFEDERGYFMESFRADQFKEYGFESDFLQDNHSCSKKGVVRGMHFQWDKPQGKLIRVTRGAAQVVEVDLRKGSPHFGNYKSFVLNETNKHILWVPPGFANGFVALEDNTEMQYKCTAVWNPDAENNIKWDDPTLDIKWHIQNPVVSERDSNALSFEQWISLPESDMFKY